MNLSKDFLISLPTMATKKFSNSLIYMHEHNGNGAAGWIINKPLDDKSSASISKEIGLKENPQPIYFGGPVNAEQAYVLHTPDLRLVNTIQLTENLCLTREKHIINMLNLGNFPSKWKIVIGQSQWGPGQLESEIYGSRTQGKSLWTNIPYREDLMWNTISSYQWSTGLKASASNKVKSLITF